MTLSITVAQFTATPEKQDNREAIAGLVAEAARAGSRLVVLPENAMVTIPGPPVDLREHAEPLDGSFVSFLGELAREHGIWIMCGMTEAIPEGERVYNTIVTLDPRGSLVARYRKAHLYDAFGFIESEVVAPGPLDEPEVIDVEGFPVGVMTCYDLRFPESARRLAVAGAEAIAVPAAWVAGPLKEDHWITLLRARAIENTVYLAAADQTGPVCVGSSSIVDPAGVVVAAAGPRPGTTSAELSRDVVVQARRGNPSLRNRRFDVTPRPE